MNGHRPAATEGGGGAASAGDRPDGTSVARPPAPVKPTTGVAVRRAAAAGLVVAVAQARAACLAGRTAHLVGADGAVFVDRREDGTWVVEAESLVAPEWMVRVGDLLARHG